MADTTIPAGDLQQPTGKLGQPTTDTAIARASSAAEQSRLLSENGPQIIHVAPDVATKETPRETIEAALPFVDLYRNAAQLSADQMRSLLDTWMSFGQGIRDIQMGWIDSISRTMTAAGGTADLWQVQRDLYKQSFDRMADVTSRVAALATRTTTQETTH